MLRAARLGPFSRADQAAALHRHSPFVEAPLVAVHDGAFAAEPIGGATRLHYFQRKADSDTLIAKLLPFSTSNPMQLERLELVYQHKGWWVYRLKD